MSNIKVEKNQNNKTWLIFTNLKWKTEDSFDACITAALNTHFLFVSSLALYVTSATTGDFNLEGLFTDITLAEVRKWCDILEQHATEFEFTLASGDSLYDAKLG